MIPFINCVPTKSIVLLISVLILIIPIITGNGKLNHDGEDAIIQGTLTNTKKTGNINISMLPPKPVNSNIQSSPVDTGPNTTTINNLKNSTEQNDIPIEHNITVGPRETKGELNSNITLVPISNVSANVDQSELTYEGFLDDIAKSSIQIEPELKNDSRVLLNVKVIRKFNNEIILLDPIELNENFLRDAFDNLVKSLKEQNIEYSINDVRNTTSMELEFKPSTNTNNVTITLNDSSIQTNCKCDNQLNSTSEPGDESIKVTTTIPEPEIVSSTTQVAKVTHPMKVPTSIPVPEQNISFTTQLTKVTDSMTSVTTITPTTLSTSISENETSTTNDPGIRTLEKLVEKALEPISINFDKPKPIPQTPWIPDGAKPYDRSSNNGVIENEIDTRRDLRNNQPISSPVSQPEDPRKVYSQRNQGPSAIVDYKNLPPQHNYPRQNNPNYNRYNVHNEVVNQNKPRSQYVPGRLYAVEEIVHRQMTPEDEKDIFTRILRHYITNALSPREIAETFVRQPPKMLPIISSKQSQLPRPSPRQP